MRRKKKFQFEFLEEALKPDIQFMLKDAEAEYSALAQQIFEGKEASPSQSYDIQAIFKEKERPVEAGAPVNDDFLKILEEARARAASVATQIFK